MNTRMWSWIVLPMMLLLAGCADVGGGDRGFESAAQVAYVANSGSNDVSAYTVSSTTGVLTAVAGPPFAAGTTPNAVTVSPNGQFLYVANGGGNVSAYTITAGTGVLVPLGAGLGNPFSAGTNPTGIATPGRP